MREKREDFERFEGEEFERFEGSEELISKCKRVSERESRRMTTSVAWTTGKKDIL